MSKVELKLQAVDGYQLSLSIFNNDHPKAVIQCIHGMEEYKERYDDFANFLASQGYVVITSDLRGHGKEAPILSHIANKFGDKLLIKDQQTITQYIKEKYPDLPIYLFAHSMGTIIARVLLHKNSKNYSKVALSGYVCPNPIAGMGVCIIDIIKLFKSPKGHSKLITNMAMGPFAKAIKDRKTDLDWLSYNEENVNNYIKDPLCGVEFTLGSYWTLLSLIKKMNKGKLYKNSNKELPFLLISGMEDPCTGGEVGRNNSLSILYQGGFHKIDMITLEHMRHEILNEIDKERVYQDILKFYEK